MESRKNWIELKNQVQKELNQNKLNKETTQTNSQEQLKYLLKIRTLQKFQTIINLLEE